MDKIVTIRTFNDYFSAHVMQQILLESGIECMLLNDNSGTVLPSLTVGGIRLQVLQADEQRAQNILNQIETEADEEQDTPAYWEQDKENLHPDNRVCVYCGSKNTSTVDATRKTFLGKKLFDMAPGLFDKDKWHCFHCGKDF
ncbi:hypothetical protein DBR32_14340 [Taibaiella sp. KBW10]|uniref:putative signal transducing protein n=1 Tax=Taibaiella sp. KBW10 TaxID=2153357 RepID=UPI000F5ABE28|nr:DUF2007 domain-containing protein [Taibaiella sp. KBW10]RQO29761.1 hypothetical protein DBR32_14340 [Taibaiella sp. KBW10]